MPHGNGAAHDPLPQGNVLENNSTKAKLLPIEEELIKHGLIEGQSINSTATTAGAVYDKSALKRNRKDNTDMTYQPAFPKEPSEQDNVPIPSHAIRKLDEIVHPLDIPNEKGFTPRMTNLMDHPGFGQLIDILAHQRYMGSLQELSMIEKHIYPLAKEVPGISMTEDRTGNIIIDVGNNEHGVLWSCHTDTVHGKSEGGRQRVVITPNGFLRLRKDDHHSCLGADDGTGVWLCINMIRGGIPGRYVFHFGEERGCIGSNWILANRPEVLANMRYAIAFDRMNLFDVVTHQGGRRSCSDAFVNSIAGMLPAGYKGDRGVWTDTGVYMDSIPECTNLSVGYYRQHTESECQDLPHLYNLLEHLLRFDASKLVCARDIATQLTQEEEERRSWTSRFRGPSGTTVRLGHGRSSSENSTAIQKILDKKGTQQKDWSLGYAANEGWDKLTPEERSDLIKAFGPGTPKQVRKSMRMFHRKRLEQDTRRRLAEESLKNFYRDNNTHGSHSNYDPDDHDSDGSRFEPIDNYSTAQDLPQKPNSIFELVRNYGAELSDVMESQGMNVEDYWGEILDSLGFTAHRAH